MEWTVPYTPEQNGVSERMNRTLVESARSMLEDSQVSKRFWGQAVQTAAYLVNRSPSSALDSNVTPFELWEGRKPDVSKLRVFGCPMFVHVPKEHHKKLDAKAWKGIFLGYSHNGYRVWDPVAKKIVRARDVDCIEGGAVMPDKVKPRTGGFMEIPAVREPAPDPEEEEAEELANGTAGDDLGGVNEDDAAEPAGDVRAEAPSGSNTDGRAIRTRTAPAWHKDFEFDYAGYALSAMEYVDNFPTTVAKAKNRDDWSK